METALERIRKACPAEKHGHHRRTYTSPTYNSWAKMLGRCLNKKDKSYPRYGGRGINACARWRQFENFLLDMGEKPAGTSIERIDNDKGYSPDNCCWASLDKQNRNKRNNVWLTHGGERKILADWSKQLGIPAETLRSRMFRGLTDEQVLSRKYYGR